MVLAPHNADDHTPWGEPGELLRRAIEEVRQSPPPPAPLNRALAQARQIGQTPLLTWPGRGIRLSIAVAVAALFITLCLRYGTNSPGGYLAETPHKHDAVDHGAGSSIATSGRGSPVTKFRGVRPPILWRAGLQLDRTGDEPVKDLLPTSLGHFGSHWGDWEGAKPLRDMARGLGPIHRHRVQTSPESDKRRQPAREPGDP